MVFLMRAYQQYPTPSLGVVSPVAASVEFSPATRRVFAHLRTLVRMMKRYDFFSVGLMTVPSSIHWWKSVPEDFRKLLAKAPFVRDPEWRGDYGLWPWSVRTERMLVRPNGVLWTAERAGVTFATIALPWKQLVPKETKP